MRYMIAAATQPHTDLLFAATLHPLFAQVRDTLLRKKEKLVSMLRAVVARVPRAMMSASSAKFSELERQVKAKTTSVEDVDAQRK